MQIVGVWPCKLLEWVKVPGGGEQFQPAYGGLSGRREIRGSFKGKNALYRILNGKLLLL